MMESAELYPYYLTHRAVSTDTRQIKPGSLFFALKGERFNGNAFAAEALEKGAAYAVIDDPAYRTGDRFVVVEDTLTALQDLAKYHRSQLQIPVIGVTGTNGKTTTKELIQTVLSQGFRAQATQGNLNNHIGVPLTLLSLAPETEIAVIEMGANHPGEIAFLCSIAQPTHGLITNVGKAHLEGFGGFEGVIRTKGELYDYLAGHGGTLFLQHDNERLRAMAADRNIKHVIRYGFSAGNDVYGQLLAADPMLHVEWWPGSGQTGHRIATQLTGAYNVENILASICIGLHFGLSPEAINQGIASYIPTNNRSQLIRTERNTVIGDYYNANASSMAAALENLHVLKAERKAAILGDMFELGDETATEHAKVVVHARSLGLDRLIFVGAEFYAHRSEGAEFYATMAEAQEALRQSPIDGALVLLKASRGMCFEQLVGYL